MKQIKTELRGMRQIITTSEIDFYVEFGLWNDIMDVLLAEADGKIVTKTTFVQSLIEEKLTKDFIYIRR